MAKFKRVYFDGRPGAIVDRMSSKVDEGSHVRTIKMVKILFDDCKESWEVADDEKMGMTPEKKAKLSKMVQVIRTAKKPTSEFYRTINQLLK